MHKLLVRHGLSHANDKSKVNTPIYGDPNAGLMDIGIEQARNIGSALINEYRIVPVLGRAATSTMPRTHETALCAGYMAENLTAHPLLDEVSRHMSLEQIGQALHEKVPPKLAIKQVEELLANPPEEEIWFTHGFVIATICYVKNIPYLPYSDFIPKHGAVRHVNI